jgi:serine/threonine protein kinase
MMVLQYYRDGNLRNNLMNNIDYKDKIMYLLCIIDGLSNIHNSGKVHKDFHSGNILITEVIDDFRMPFISDLGMCQPIDNEEQEIKNEGVYGVLPYMAPEVLHGYQYTKAADIYSFGIMMNEKKFLIMIFPMIRIWPLKYVKDLDQKFLKIHQN